MWFLGIFEASERFESSLSDGLSGSTMVQLVHRWFNWLADGSTGSKLVYVVRFQSVLVCL